MDEPFIFRKRAWKGEKEGQCSVATGAFWRDVWRIGMSMGEAASRDCNGFCGH